MGNKSQLAMKNKEKNKGMRLGAKLRKPAILTKELALRIIKGMLLAFLYKFFKIDCEAVGPLNPHQELK